jgi:2-polyprenyl-6-methoxyphenol hydroxylase and related FAD-dependent oxidoreductases
MTGFGVNEGYFLMRSDLVKAMYDYAKSLRISMQFDCRVTSYWEKEDRAGIIVNGERVEGDCVIASDGVYSKARAALKGDKYPLIGLGSVMHRSGGFPSKSLRTAEAAQWLFNTTEKQDRMLEILHEETIFFFGTFQRGKGVYWACMHQVSNSC